MTVNLPNFCLERSLILVDGSSTFDFGMAASPSSGCVGYAGPHTPRTNYYIKSPGNYQLFFPSRPSDEPLENHLRPAALAARSVRLVFQAAITKGNYLVRLHVA